MEKSELGRLGIWAMAGAMSTQESVALAQKIEQLGYDSWWVPDMVGRDQFLMLGAMAQATTSLKLATGITIIHTRDPGAMAEAYYTLNEISGGRFILGLGVSHKEFLKHILNVEYGKPLTAMRNFLAQMKESPYQLNFGEYQQMPLEKEGMIVLAALQDGMIRLGGTEADGIHPFFVTPEHTAHARELLGPEPLIAPEQHVLLIKDPTEARQIARQHMSFHLGLQNYRNYLKKFGYTDEDFENGGSDRLVDDIVAWGDETKIMKRIEEHWKNGADHVAMQPLTRDGSFGFDAQAIEALAPAIA